MRGAEGFGLHQRLRTDRLLTLSEDLPIVSVAVDERARIEAVLGEVGGLGFEGLVTLERARMLSGRLEPVVLSPGLGEEAKLTIYAGRRERAGGRPAFDQAAPRLFGTPLDALVVAPHNLPSVQRDDPLPMGISHASARQCCRRSAVSPGEFIAAARANAERQNALILEAYPDMAEVLVWSGSWKTRNHRARGTGNDPAPAQPPWCRCGC